MCNGHLWRAGLFTTLGLTFVVVVVFPPLVTGFKRLGGR